MSMEMLVVDVLSVMSYLIKSCILFKYIEKRYEASANQYFFRIFYLFFKLHLSQFIAM